MTAPQISYAYPVDWPIGRKKEGGHKQALWKSGGSRLNFDQAVARLREQIGAIRSMRSQSRAKTGARAS